MRNPFQNRGVLHTIGANQSKAEQTRAKQSKPEQGCWKWGPEPSPLETALSVNRRPDFPPPPSPPSPPPPPSPTLAWHRWLGALESPSRPGLIGVTGGFGPGWIGIAAFAQCAARALPPPSSSPSSSPPPRPSSPPCAVAVLSANSQAKAVDTLDGLEVKSAQERCRIVQIVSN